MINSIINMKEWANKFIDKQIESIFGLIYFLEEPYLHSPQKLQIKFSDSNE